MARDLALALACYRKKAAHTEECVEGPIGCIDSLHTLEEHIYLARHLSSIEALHHSSGAVQNGAPGSPDKGYGVCVLQWTGHDDQLKQRCRCRTQPYGL